MGSGTRARRDTWRRAAGAAVAALALAGAAVGAVPAARGASAAPAGTPPANPTATSGPEKRAEPDWSSAQPASPAGRAREAQTIARALASARGTETTAAGGRATKGKVSARLRTAGARGEANATAVVEILHTGDDAAVAQAVRSHGGTVRGTVPGSVTLAEVPESALDALAAVASVTAIRPPQRIDEIARQTTTTLAPPVVGGDLLTRTGAAAWHANGYVGTGVKVALVDSFDGSLWSMQRSLGLVPDVPLDHQYCRVFGYDCSVFDLGETHGNSTAQVLTSMAPGIELYLVDVATNSDLSAALDWLSARGVHILSRSLGAPVDGPGDGRGVSADVVRQAVAKGILFVNAAGNEGAGSYWRGTWNDPDGDGIMNFSGGSPYLLTRAYCPLSYLAGMRWSDWGASRTDYDLWAYHPDSGTVEPISVDDQATAPPVEAAPVDLCDYRDADGYVRLVIDRYNGSPGADGDVIELLGNGSDEVFQGWSSPYSATGPHVDVVDPGALSVGAIASLSSTQIASYSSRGPLNNGAGIKPDLAAPACLSTISYACFQGTSASTPVVAGAAALAWGAFGGSPGTGDAPRWLGTYLRQYAYDRGAPGIDTDFGSGEVRLPPPPAPVATGKVIAGSVKEVKVTGVGGVPANVAIAAVSLNVTVTQSDGAGYVTVYPCGARPLASNLNFERGQTVPNAVLAPVSASGTVCFYASATTHLLADVNGWFPVAAAGFQPLTPARLFDTRDGTGGVSANIRVPAGGTLDYVVAGTGGVPASGVAAVSLNVTVTQPQQNGYVTVYACGSRPFASNLNYVAGQTVPNAVLAPVSPSGHVCFFSLAETHLLADVNGWVPIDASGFQALTPSRLFDTRDGTGGVPAAVRVAADGTLTVPVTGRAGVPANGVAAVAMNVTVTDPTASGYVTVYPCGSRPLASNLNYVAGQTAPNLVVTPVSPDGKVCFYALGATHLLADVNGWFPVNATGFQALTPSRLFDTRG